MADTPKEKKVDWNVPWYILAMLFALGIGLQFFFGSLYDARNPIEWFIATMFRLLGPVLIGALVYYLVKGEDEKKPPKKSAPAPAPAPAPGPAPAPAAH
jgi:hypothetical protein